MFNMYDNNLLTSVCIATKEGYQEVKYQCDHQSSATIDSEGGYCEIFVFFVLFELHSYIVLRGLLIVMRGGREIFSENQ